MQHFGVGLTYLYFKIMFITYRKILQNYINIKMFVPQIIPTPATNTQRAPNDAQHHIWAEMAIAELNFDAVFSEVGRTICLHGPKRQS